MDVWNELAQPRITPRREAAHRCSFLSISGYATFEVVSISFSQEKWELLIAAQRHLCLHVMLENFPLITSIGKYVTLWSFLIFFFPEPNFPLHC
jgi:hypothetical protein